MWTDAKVFTWSRTRNVGRDELPSRHPVGLQEVGGRPAVQSLVWALRLARGAFPLVLTPVLRQHQAMLGPVDDGATTD